MIDDVSIGNKNNLNAIDKIVFQQRFYTTKWRNKFKSYQMSPLFVSVSSSRFFSAVDNAYQDELSYYKEMEDFLGGEKGSCYRLEYIATKLDHLGKGLGGQVIEVMSTFAGLRKKVYNIYFWKASLKTRLVN